jgi:hypothetical protein
MRSTFRKDRRFTYDQQVERMQLAREASLAHPNSVENQRRQASFAALGRVGRVRRTEAGLNETQYKVLRTAVSPKATPILSASRKSHHQPFATISDEQLRDLASAGFRVNSSRVRMLP